MDLVNEVAFLEFSQILAVTILLSFVLGGVVGAVIALVLRGK